MDKKPEKKPFEPDPEIFKDPQKMKLFTKMLGIFLEWARSVPEIMAEVEKEPKEKDHDRPA